MHLRILVPSAVFADKADVSRITFGTRAGHFGLLALRLDCVAALVPGILCYATPSDGEIFVGVDSGALVKTGTDVQVSVRRAIGGSDLHSLREAVEREFLQADADERRRRLVIARLEHGLLRRIADLGHA